MTSPVVIVLDGAPEEAAERLGGKGAALASLIAGGFQVPPTAVVLPAAYRSFVAIPSIHRCLADIQHADPDDAAIDELFLRSPLPAAVAAAVRRAALTVGRGGLVAVRSSATAEDLAAASFAGQYSSFLRVHPDDVPDRLRLTWASLWHRAPRAYRRYRGIDESGLDMAVVLMRMVPARLAGVAFTVDPTGSDPRVMRIEAVEGLGEALVSGAVTPDEYLVERTEAKTLPEPLDRVAGDALDVERYLGTPQDVEWAWDGTTDWIVQSRPITTIGAAAADDDFDTEPDEHRRYTTVGIAEMLPGVLPPLVWDVSSFLAEEAFNRTFDALTAVPAGGAGPHEMVGRMRGRAVLNLDRLAGVATALPGGSAEELERQYVGSTEANRMPPPERTNHGWRSLRHDLRILAAQRHSLRDAEIVAAAYGEMDPVRIDLASRSDRSLLAYRLRLIDLGCRAMAAELGVAAAAVAAYRRLELLLLRYLGEDGASRFAQRVTRGAALSPLLPAAAAVLDRVDEATTRELPESWEEARSVLEAGGLRRPIHRFERLLDRADSMAVFAGPTWREFPDRLWALCRAQALLPAVRAVQAAEEARAELERSLAESPGWRRTRWITAQVVDVRLRLLRRLIRDTRDLLTRRELVKQTVLDLGGRVRDVHLELGRRLTEAGVLDCAEDVDYLSSAELARAMAGPAPSPHTIAGRRRVAERRRHESGLPALFMGRPESAPVPIAVGDRLEGWAAGPGRATGKPRIVADPDSAALQRDEVLVALRTDASWSPLFLRAGAVVVEEGGPLSHAAIVARELGLPAVMNIPGIVSRLGRCAENTEITVDGDLGVVTIHTGEEDA